MIRRLPEDVRACLRSGLVVVGVAQCVEELALNSLDAQATCAAVRVHMDSLRVQVVDNGFGMSREDVESVGSRYFTSKCHSLEDLENLRLYGFRGEALASIVTMASVVEISSRTNKSLQTFTKLFQNGKAHAASEAELARPSVGTTVTVCNLLYNLPVRRKCMDGALEFERIRQRVEAVALMHPAVSFSLRNDATALMALQLPKTKDVCARFSQIYGLSRSQKLREIRFKQKGFELNGYISSEGHYNKNIQFLYVNSRLILKTRLHKLIDFLLKKESNICKLKCGPSSRQTSLSPSRHKSATELHGIYVINIKCHYSEYDICIEPAKTLIEFSNWDSVLECVEKGVQRFLNRENLFVESSSDDVKECNENSDFKLLHNDIQHIIADVNVHNSFSKACRGIMDPYKLSNLKSKVAQRKTESVTTEENSIIVQGSPDVTTVESICYNGVERDIRRSFSDDKHVDCENQRTTTTYRQAAELKGIRAESTEHSTMCHLTPEPPISCGQSLLDISVGECSVQAPLLLEDSKADINHKCTQPETDPANITAISLKGCNQIEKENITQTFHGGHEIIDESDFVLERTSLDGYDVRKKLNKELGSKERGRNDNTLQMELCYTGHLAHPMPNQVSETNEIKNDPLNLFARLGPISAQEIFGNEMSVLAQAENVTSLSGVLKRGFAGLQSGGVRRCDTDSLKEKCTLKDKNNQESFYVFDDSGRKDDSTWQHISDFSLMKDNVNGQNTTKQLFSNSRKLNLHAHIGSLERFRRHYGKTQSSVPFQNDGSESSLTSSFSVLTEPEHVRSCSNHLKCCSDCVNIIAEPIGSKNSNLAALALDNSYNQFVEKCLILKDDAFLHRKITCPERESLIWSDYTLQQEDAVSISSLRPLAIELTRMKGDQEKVLTTEKSRHFMQECQANQSRKDMTWELLEANEAIDQRAKHSFQRLSVNNQTESCRLSYTAGEMSDSCSSITASCGGEDENVQGFMYVSKTGECADSPNIHPDLEAIEVSSGGGCVGTGTVDLSLIHSFQNGEFLGVASPLKLEDDLRETASQFINDGRSPSSCDWLQYFDSLLGRTVYINRATGLSSYIAPSKENRTICSNDLTTLAVDVGSSIDDEAAGGSLQSSLLAWENPVFARHSEVAVDVSSSQAQRLAVKIHNILYPYRFTKKMVHSMKVLNQVDNKFIACLISTKTEETADTDGNLLVLVDQHAAHERIRLEQLITESYELQPDMSDRKKLLSSTMYPPLEVEVTEEERRLLRSYQRSLEELGLGISFPEACTPTILVHRVPLCFVEKEAIETRRGRQTVTKSIVEEFIREQVELLQTAGGARGSLPPTVLKVLASQACHGAIKFNDSLSAEESCSLIEALSKCQLPFQCAHGRPSMLPLADTDHLQPRTQIPPPNLKRLRKLFKAWQLFEQQEQLPLLITY